VNRYLELTKPRITLFILMSTGVGFLFGTHLGKPWTWMELFHTLLGTMLIAGGTAALNQWYEREGDGLMNRTKARPIPSGRITADHALTFGTALSAAGFSELWLGANLLTALLALFTLASYLFVDTPLKRVSPISTTIGAIPGAMPPLIGYAAATGHLNYEAGILFAILFLWQFPHFYAIAWMYREDYARGGYLTLPRGEKRGQFMMWQTLICSAALLLVSLVPTFAPKQRARGFRSARSYSEPGSCTVPRGWRWSDRTRPHAGSFSPPSSIFQPFSS
jgi:heme o synthase